MTTSMCNVPPPTVVVSVSDRARLHAQHFPVFSRIEPAPIREGLSRTGNALRLPFTPACMAMGTARWIGRPGWPAMAMNWCGVPRIGISDAGPTQSICSAPRQRLGGPVQFAARARHACGCGGQLAIAELRPESSSNPIIMRQKGHGRARPRRAGRSGLLYNK